ncbi:hypothetical protein F5878DRAFT_667378 [Lentinula raphanica]|uniref:Uncharacterized protein n=1 Tax=Lentinula raphanica TaxID=153919 RepID=A0AA38NVX2_9AGAR|nr:hypothetical protein F5878DRAFT_667378 [Lentinula raphanica]
MPRPPNSIGFSGHKRKRKSHEERHQQTASASASAAHWTSQDYSSDSSLSPDKENSSPIRLLQSEKTAYQKKFYNSQKKVKQWEDKHRTVSAEKEMLEAELEEKDEKIETLVREAEYERQRADELHLDKARYQRENHALREKIRCVPQRLETAMKRVRRMPGVMDMKETTVHLKKKGVITDNIRSMLCDLVALDNVPSQNVVDAHQEKYSHL